MAEASPTRESSAADIHYYLAADPSLAPLIPVLQVPTAISSFTHTVLISPVSGLF
jgi:hypothetical protein